MRETRETTGGECVAWEGNAAKARIVREILDEASRRDGVVVFDFGCGEAQQWPQVLRAAPAITLIAFEPNVRRARRAAEVLQPLGATVHSGPRPTSITARADLVVSFSVFEHVRDKGAYLSDAKRILASDGTFYLNYDDGHFRPQVDLDRVSTWTPAVKSSIYNLLSPALGTNRYRARVHKETLSRLLARTGFVVTDERYENLTAFKELAKTLRPEDRERFSGFWLEVEERLNRDFRSDGEPTRGDPVNLWTVMASRTLTLRHAVQ
jgi:SAM-dependent methyltransferase